MSAVVCGKRHLFEEQHPLHHHISPSPQPPSKRRRPSSSEPVIGTGGLDRLRSLFPEMTRELLEEALEASGNDLNAAIKRLLDLRLDPVEGCVAPSAQTLENGMPSEDLLADKDTLSSNDVVKASTESLCLNNAEVLPASGPEWVEVLVKEMASAGDINDARCRASRVLEAFDNFVRSHVGSEAMQNFQKENVMLKEQMEALLRENSILKRAVAIQHERQKEHNDKNQELQQLRQLLVQCQGQVHNLELSNYALSMHLKQAQQNSSIPGRFHPDIL